MSTKGLTFGSLYSGIGGFDLGLQWAGMTPRWQVEKDDFCRRVLAKHWPDVARYEADTDVGKHNLESVDLICGGFPCQPFSQAGQQRGEADDRNRWPEMRRIVEELRPRWVVGENVAGLINVYLDRVLADLEAQGYEAWAVVIPAAAVNAPHRRDRVFILAHTECYDTKHERAIGEMASTQRQGESEEDQRQWVWDATRGSSAAVGNAHSQGSQGWSVQPQRAGEWLTGQAGMGHPTGEGLPDWAGGTMGQPSPLTEFERPSGREVERNFRGISYGVSRRVDRLRALGNAVVPQLVCLIGQHIIEIERGLAG